MNKRAAILGYGVTGESVLGYLLREGIEAIVIDTRAPRATPVHGVEFLWETAQWPGLDVDFAVVSPGLDMDDPLVAGTAASGIPLVSDIDLFFDAVTAPVIGVTGTNGKSTVTSLVGHFLRSAGISCGVGGNLGVAALDVLDPGHQCYVLELSSFQLERSREHRFHTAAILNVTEDHLDKHGDMAGYLASKQRIYARSGRCVYNRMDPRTRPGSLENAVSFGLDTPRAEQDWGIVEEGGERYLQRGSARVCAARTLKLAGVHNELNALAACALAEGLVEVGQMATALSSFSGLAHRFEVVAELHGVTYVNDSKATNLGATMAALAGMPCTDQVILVAGGDAKGVDLSALGKVLPGRVRHVLTLGKDGPGISQVAACNGIDNEQCRTLEEAVLKAAALAQPDDTVLLSPACASLDMFDSYVQRGDLFVRAVRTLCAANAHETARGGHC